MKVIDGKGAILGRLASYVAKELLKGEKIAIVNSDQIIISGNKKSLKIHYEERTRRGGHGFLGPKYSMTTEKVVKRTIRGMIHEHRWGRGKEVLKNVRCYKGIPKEFENEKKIIAGKGKPIKYIEVREITK